MYGMNAYLCVLLCALRFAHAQDGPAVNTIQGVVIGTVYEGNYSAFYGIPYGGNTSGNNRFKAPTPPLNYYGVFQAVEKNVTCAQPSSKGLIGTEDCLKLDIYTNNVTTPKPILVLIQGEDFASQRFQPFFFTKLLQEGLVIVTVNYRLSIFGFLCLGVPGAPGNAGLKDVVQALKWIQTNIAAFGGNPNNVVLLGHGSGAAMVDLITLSPLAKGLIHKAIVLSGSGLAPWAVAYDPIGHANAVGEKLNYTGKDKEELAQLLATTDINLLGHALKDFEFLNNTVLFGPCIEDVSLNPNDTFLGNVPINIIRAGNYCDIPYISGHTNREGTIRAKEIIDNRWMQRMQADFKDFIQLDLNFESDSNGIVISSIHDFYFSHKTQTIENVLDYIGNTTIHIPMIRNVKERALTSSSEVRIFEFAYQGTLNSDWPEQIPVSGAKHGAILNYLFDFDLKPSDNFAQRELIQRFTVFAYTGNPNIQNETDWLPMEKIFTNALYITGQESPPLMTVFFEQLTMGYDQPGRGFWNSIFAKYYRPPNPVGRVPSPSSADGLVTFSFWILVSQLFVYFFRYY